MQHHAIGTSANMPDKDKPSVEENGDFVAVHNPLLCYVHYLLHSHDDHAVVRVEALSKFSYDSIVEAKRILWNTEYACGEFQQRKDSAKRTAKEAHLQDIMEALTHMDTLDNWNIKDVHDTFKLCIDSLSLREIMRTKNKEDMMNQRLHMLEQKVSQLINVVDKYITENNNLKKDIEKLSSIHQKTYAEVVATTNMEGKSAPPAEGTDDKTKSIAPRTSVTPVHSITQSEVVKTGITDEIIDMRGKGNTDSIRVPEAKPSSAAASHFGFHLRKNKQRRRIITGNSVSCKGVAGAPEPTRHLFIKRITKDTENDAVKNMILSYGFGIRDFRCISHPEARFKSFKLSVPASQFERLFDEKLWPEGVVVRIYTTPRSGQQ